jgi:hypothetical protein
MTRRGDDRETSGAIDFDAALEEYTFGGDAEALLRAASNVLGSTIRSIQSTPRPSRNSPAARACLRTMTTPAGPCAGGSPPWRSPARGTGPTCYPRFAAALAMAVPHRSARPPKT